jgi:DNA-binding transcriptional MerR regulator
MSNEFGTFSKEVAIHLDINPSTLRRWASELEKQGYKFERNDKNNRIFYDKDILALSDLKRLLDKTQSIEIATKTVAKQHADRKSSEKAIAALQENDAQITLTKDELEEYTKKNIIQQTAKQTAMAIKEQLTEEITGQVIQKMQQVEEQRDRKLMQSIRATLDEKKKIEIEMAATVQKESFWTRLFGFGKKNKAKDSI